MQTSMYVCAAGRHLDVGMLGCRPGLPRLLAQDLYAPIAAKAVLVTVTRMGRSEANLRRILVEEVEANVRGGEGSASDAHANDWWGFCRNFDPKTSRSMMLDIIDLQANVTKSKSIVGSHDNNVQKTGNERAVEDSR